MNQNNLALIGGSLLKFNGLQIFYARFFIATYLLPNISYWTEKYSNSDVDYIYLHCPYLCNPWQITRFGKKIGKGDFETGDV